MIYCDTAATTPLDPNVLKEIIDVLSKKFGNPSSIHRYGQEARAIIENSRRTIAYSLNAEPSEIYFTAGGSESNNIVLRGLLKPQDHLITSSIEHPAILEPAKELEKKGIKLTILEPDKYGQIQPETLINAIRKNTKLVSIMTANNEIGTINDIKTLSHITKNAGALFHTDAVQAIGKISIDLNDLKIDFLSASGHKFYGPNGIGFLFIKRGHLLNGLITGGGQEKGLRAGTENTAGIAGIGKAIEIASTNLTKNLKYIKSLERKFFSDLDKSDIRYRRNGTEQLPGLLNITFFGNKGQSIIMNLDLKGIAISYGSACASGTAKPSAILSKIGLTEAEAISTVRISFCWHNTLKDISTLTNALSEIISSSKVEKKYA